jgi:threonine/homoserine/homoserine lactone efflux protein
MFAQAIIAFLLLAVPQFFTPGPNNIMLMASTARFGARRTLAHALGVTLGFPAMVFAVGLGLGQLMEIYPWLHDVLRWVAIAYLLWMAWHLLGFSLNTDAQTEGRPMTFVEAAAFQWINPKAWAMAVSFVGAMVLPGDGRLLSIVLLTLGCLALAPFSTWLWMFFGQQLVHFLRRTRSERALGVILALSMLAAIALFVF